MSAAFVFGAQSRLAMVGVHPDLIRVAYLGLRHSIYDFAVTEGVRGERRQRDLVARGWSRTMSSKHLLHADGYGHAIDVVAVGDLNGDGITDAQDRMLRWDPAVYTAIAVAMQCVANELGVKIRWGGDFKSFFDGPHFELV